MVEHLLSSMPKLLRFYTSLRLHEYAPSYFKDKSYVKNSRIFAEGVPFNQLLFISEGSAFIYKKITYLDQNDKPQESNEKIMEVQKGDVVGEDHAFFQRPAQYSLVSGSQGFKAYAIDSHDFTKHFGKVISSK